MMMSPAGKQTQLHHVRPSLADEAFDLAVVAMLAHRKVGGEHLARALEADPKMIPALVLRGFGLRKLGRKDQFGAIEELLRGMPSTEDPRERTIVEALSAWVVDDGPKAAELLDAQLMRAPRDLLLMKLSHGVRFMLGDSRGMLESVERVVEAHDETDVGYGFLLGCYSFALEETGSLDAAERAGRRAVELEPLDVWAAHSVAHVMFMQKRHEEGAAWLRAYSPRLEGCTNLAGHVDWHEALCLYELDRREEALDLFDRRVAGYLDGDYRDLSNAVSLLFRLARAGVDVGDRWQRYADFALQRQGDHGSAFADVHYALALCGAGRPAEAARFVASMTSCAHFHESGFDATVTREVGAPLAGAVVDLYTNRSGAAFETFSALSDQVQRIGGSHAQRALIGWMKSAAEQTLAADPPPATKQNA